jgi:hypothetical protein
MFLAAALLVLLAPAKRAFGDDSVLEYKVKASYLYKFGEFVNWPLSAFGSPASVVNLCVAGKDPFGLILDQAVAGQRIAQRPITIRRLEVVGRNSGCHILYVGGSERQSVAQALDAVHGANMLTVTETNSEDAKGIINFITKNGHVRFDIDEPAVSRSGLTISSKLLELALSFRRKAS